MRNTASKVQCPALAGVEPLLLAGAAPWVLKNSRPTCPLPGLCPARRGFSQAQPTRCPGQALVLEFRRFCISVSVLWPLRAPLSSCWKGPALRKWLSFVLEALG